MEIEDMNLQQHLRRKSLSQISLSKNIKSILLGSLLGDGSLQIYKRYKNAKFSIRHSNTQKDYLFWKVCQLKNEIPGKITQCNPDGFSTKVKWIFQSNVSEDLTKIYEITHPKKKKRIKRKWLNHLGLLGLAIWWFDDGSLICHRRRGVFCTDNFTKKECQLLKNYLVKVHSIKVKVAPIHRKNLNKSYYRLWICNSELQKFLTLIASVVPLIHCGDLFDKKMIIRYKNPVLQQRWISKLHSILKKRETYKNKEFFDKFRERYSPITLV